MPFQIIRNDITKVKADAIVNSANPKPIYAGGTDAAVYKAAGADELLKARWEIGEIKPGDAFSTPAFALDAKYIIHTVGPVWEGGKKGELDTLRSCYEKSLDLALSLKCKSVAFPLISTGVYGFPKDEALKVATSAIQAFLLEHKMKVILVVFDKKAFELSGNIFDKVEAYVDANYVAEAKIEEYKWYSETSGELDIEDVYRRRRFTGSKPFDWPGMAEDGEPVICASSTSSGKVDIDDLIASQDMTFQEKLFELIDERGLSGPQVYGPVDISKQVFSKIQCDKDYHPNKATAILFCISLKLDIDATMDLLNRAGWTLSPSSKADLVIKGCIINKLYNKVDIELILFDKCNMEIKDIK